MPLHEQPGHTVEGSRTLEVAAKSGFHLALACLVSGLGLFNGDPRPFPSFGETKQDPARG
jgi:hypothetical protein